MKYCRSCILPATRPQIVLDDTGLCNACANHGGKANIDWKAREVLFRDVVRNAKTRSKGYDCVIPVSGGKDSTWQVVKCLEYGLNPLAVTWKPPARTPIGQENLNNLMRLGVDHIDYSINPKVERKFLLEAYRRFGSAAVPMHMAMFNIPLNVAVKFDIPLVVWGENSAFEYGSRQDANRGFQLDNAWLKNFGVTHGTTARDWVSENLTEKEMTPYFSPSEELLKSRGTLAVFLGYYFPWDPMMTAKVAQEHGFKAGVKAKTGYYNFADIDDDFISIHHYVKWHKFGFTRTYDNLSLEIRNGRMTRQKAIEVLRERGDETPNSDIEKFCAFTGIGKKEFFETAEKFRNQQIWTKDNGVWKIDNFLIPDWTWT